MTALAIVFGSGLCSLVYQSVWLRDLRLVFGASTPSNAAVTAIFMGGLGLGGLYFGRRLERDPTPLQTYWKIELGVSLLALISPLLTDLVRSIYLSLGGTTALGMLRTPVHLVLATIVLGPSVFVMGGTLPAMSRAVVGLDEHNRSSVAWLYGVNTLGAVVGVFFPTFILFEYFGFRTVLVMGVGLNLVLTVIARRFAQASPAIALAPGPSRVPTDPPASRNRVRLLALTAALGTGFAFFVLELVWYRTLSPILGGSTYTFGTILVMALLGIGTGGAIHALWSQRQRATIGAFGLSAIAQVIVALLPFAAGDELARLAAFLQAFASHSFFALSCSWFVVALFVVFPASCVAGFQFPMLVSLVGEGREGVAKDLGTIYLVNTIGSILGALAGGFVLVPMLGASTTWLGVGFTLAAVGVAFVAADRSAKALIPAAVGVACIAGLAAQPGPGPIWLTTGVGIGAYATTRTNAVALEQAKRNATSRIIDITDGRESTVAVTADSGLAFIVNGKPDGHALSDAPTQIGLGLIPALLHGAPRDAFVVGLGTGETAGWLAAASGVERVDVAEFEPAVLPFARQCGPVNFDAMSNPKVHIIDGDGREVLQTTRSRYDLILSEPSNPYRAGLSGFYSVDFYTAAKDRLRDDGLYAQWLQAYAVSDETILVALRSLREVFEHVEIWHLLPNDLLLVASNKPVVLDATRIATAMEGPVMRRAFSRVFSSPDVEGLAAYFVAGNATVDNLIKGTPFHTDDRPLLEFFFAKSVGLANQSNAVLRLRDTELRRGGGFPRIEGPFDAARSRALRAHAFVRSARTVPPVIVADLGSRDDAQLLAHFGGAPGERPTVLPPRIGDDYQRVLWGWMNVRDAGADEWSSVMTQLSGTEYQREARVLDELRQATGPSRLKRLLAAVEEVRAEPLFDMRVGGLLFEELEKAVLTAPQDRPLVVETLSRPLPIMRFESQRLRLLEFGYASATGDYAHPDCGAFFESRRGRLRWEREALARQAACAELVAPELREHAETENAAFLGQLGANLLGGAGGDSAD